MNFLTLSIPEFQTGTSTVCFN